VSARAASASGEKGNVSDYMHLFVSQTASLLTFLELAIGTLTAQCDASVFSTLLELYLKRAADAAQSVNAVTQAGASTSTALVPATSLQLTSDGEKVSALLSSQRAQFDIDHALMLCQLYKFRPGVLRLCERAELYDDLLRLYCDSNDHRLLIQTCLQYGEREPTLWLRALQHFTALAPNFETELKEVLGHIDASGLLPPLLVVQQLALNANATLGPIKPYIIRRVARAEQRRRDDERRATQLREETTQMRNEIAELQGGAVLFQANKCATCSSAIELPAVHFLCMHSYHQRCLDDVDSPCPLCTPERVELERRAAVQAHHAERGHEDFFAQLRSGDDGFDVVADYFGKNIFNQVHVLGDVERVAGSVGKAPPLSDVDARAKLLS